ncbi:MAG: lytic transglycosylase domain-containing protein [Blastocatellia bacterium]
MRSTARLITLALFALFVSDARAQEASIPLNVGAVAEQLQRTPSLVIHEVVKPPASIKPVLDAGLKAPGAQAKNATSKSSAAGAAGVLTPHVNASPPVVLPSAVSTSVSTETTTTGNPKYDALIAQSAARNGVDPNLIVAIMRQESGFNLRALSYKGASGLMQLMPATARRFGVTNIFDPAQNIEGGTRYLRFLLDSFNGDVSLVLAGYNAGENAVVNSGYRVPRYRETQNYVRSITARYDASRNNNTKRVTAVATAAPAATVFSGGASSSRLSNNY